MATNKAVPNSKTVKKMCTPTATKLESMCVWSDPKTKRCKIARPACVFKGMATNIAKAIATRAPIPAKPCKRDEAKMLVGVHQLAIVLSGEHGGPKESMPQKPMRK